MEIVKLCGMKKGSGTVSGTTLQTVLANLWAKKPIATAKENMRGVYVPMSGDVAQTFALMADSTGLVGMTHSINSRDASVDTLLMSCVKFFPEFEDCVFIGTIGNGTGA